MPNPYRRGKSKIYWGRVGDERRSLRTEDRAIAKARLKQWRNERNARAWGDKPRRTFVEAAEKFACEHMTTLSLGGAKRYGVSLKRLALHFGPMMLDQITKVTLNDFEVVRRTEGVSNGTIRRDLSCLSSLMTSAQDWEWIEDGANPVPSYMRRRNKRGLSEAPPRTRYLTESEEARLLAVASPTVRDAATLAIETGLRSNELFGLQWSQIDFARGIIDTGTKTKSGRSRYVPLTQRSRTILGTIPRRLDTPYVLVNPDTGTRYVTMLAGLRIARRKAGIALLVWHDLRRTAGCRWLQRDGRSMAEVATLLGHSSVSVTEQRYAFLNSETVAESVGGGTKGVTGTAELIPIRKVSQ